MASEAITLGVLAERLEGVRVDVQELRAHQREGDRRTRAVERAVQTMVDAQATARELEARQYRRIANAIQLGALLMAAAMVALSIITLNYH